MKIDSSTPRSYDPVSKVSIRLATKEDIKECEGGTVWKILSTPCYYLSKVMGSAQMIFAGSNILKWDRSYPQEWAEKICWYVGWKPEEVFMRTIHNFILGDSHRIRGSSKVIEKILKFHRNDQFFQNAVSMNQFLVLLQRVWPKENFTSEDFMMTCSQENTKFYRKILSKLLNRNKVREFSKEIDFEIQQTLAGWLKEQQPVNVTVRSRFFTSRIICKLMFGDSSCGQKITEAIDFFNDYVIKSLLKKNTEEDDKKFKKMAISFAETIEEVLKKEDIPIFSDKKEIEHPFSDTLKVENEKDPLSINQKRALIFIVFFAGQETTAALLSWTLREIALDPEMQEELYEEAFSISKSDHPLEKVVENEKILRLFSTTIADFPPAYAVSRKVKENLVIEYTLQRKNITHKKILRKNEIVAVELLERAKLAIESYNGKLDEHDWMPFGSGKHRCPGEQLARSEILFFIYEIVLNYKISCDYKPISKIGLVTLKTDEDILISMTPRN